MQFSPVNAIVEPGISKDISEDGYLLCADIPATTWEWKNIEYFGLLMTDMKT